MYDILNQNLQYLEKKSQDLANRLREIEPDPSIELLTAVSGDLTARKCYQDGSYQFIHSTIDPRQEARMWVHSQRIMMPCLVIIGIGLAYHAFELFKKCGSIEKAYLIETDERIFQLALTVHDFSDIIRNPAVHLLAGYPFPVIEKILAAALMKPFSCHIFSPVVSLHAELYSPLIEFIQNRLCNLRLKEEDGGVEYLLNQMTET